MLLIDKASPSLDPSLWKFHNGKEGDSWEARVHPEGSLVWTKSYQGCEEVQKHGFAGQVLSLITLTFPGGKYSLSCMNKHPKYLLEKLEPI